MMYLLKCPDKCHKKYLKKFVTADMVEVNMVEVVVDMVEVEGLEVALEGLEVVVEGLEDLEEAMDGSFYPEEDLWIPRIL